MEERRKYPRTPHLPGSPGCKGDDFFGGISEIYGTPVVVTEKMDGECTALYRDGLHARSLDSRHHPSRDWVKAFHAHISYRIDTGMVIYGENLYAEHSIHYSALPSYFMGFAIANLNDFWIISWDETMASFAEIGIEPVPVVAYLEHPDVPEIKRLAETVIARGGEGVVVRPVGAFPGKQLERYVFKYVRGDHVQTDQHWSNGPIIPNRMLTSD